MTENRRFNIVVDGQPVPCTAGDPLVVPLLQAGLHPTGGGCLCLAGDCPHCLISLDGVSYVRSCQVSARPGMVVERHHQAGSGYPPLPDVERHGADVPVRHIHCDVVVIGGGEAGQTAVAAAQEAGQDVLLLDARAGQEVIGIYVGPQVIARTPDETLHVHPHHEIIVATGAAEIQPVAPGNDLAGLLTARAAAQLASYGLDLGHVVAIGTPPEGLAVEQLSGELIRFEGEGRVQAVVMQQADGSETRHPCDTVALGLGFHPRNALSRMGHGLPVRTVGDAARPSDIPPCPKAGTVCPCSGIGVEHLDAVWERGFQELELVKRATLAGTGTCQGSVCLPYIRSFLADRGEELQPPFTARPVTRQLTIGEVSAGHYLHPTARTPLDAEHRRLGAQMERIGGWWRPWRYANLDEEYWAVREAVSIGDVSTLGKMIVSGPDALELLERLYPTKVTTIRPGRSRYVLLLNERGYVLDDGLICCESPTRYLLTFTSAGSTVAELWLRDWADSWGLDVRILNQTFSLGAINVTGPLSKVLLARAGLAEPPAYMRHITAEVAGVACRVFRLSFTGELSFELHHAAADSVQLWRVLTELGADLGLKPHGIDALLKLRLEKGHIVVGQDTDFDSTPRRIHHEWAVKLDKPAFVGRQAVIRTNKQPLNRQLVGLTCAGANWADAPIEGATIWNKGTYAGYVTSSTYSPILRQVVMLGWVALVDGELPQEVQVNGRSARLTPVPFYDPEATRARA